MLRFISLVTVREGTDVEAIVTAGGTMCRNDPDIRQGTVAAGLGLMRSAGAPEADYSMVLNFADAEAMNRWATGPAHQKFGETIGDVVASFVVTQFAI
jgi:antibiotic biosynthesis monooxygenase (ABM) superfamily enzyme